MNNTEEADRIFRAQNEFVIKAKKGGCFVVGDDGYYVFFPTHGGGISEWMLRAIADELESLNKDWDAALQKFEQNNDQEQLALGI